jgi:hypothetical protein
MIVITVEDQLRKLKRQNNDLLILGLLALAFLGKGPLAGGTPPGRTSTDPTSRGSSDPTMGRSNSPGENDQPPDMSGVNSRSGPGNDVQNFPGGSSGVPDKSKSQSSPPNMPPMMMPPSMMPPNVANVISPTPPSGGTVLPGGNIFVPGLSDTGLSMGGPGPGPNTPSITTVYGGKTYTNFNPMLLDPGVNMKTPGVAMAEVMNKATPQMSAPMMVPGRMFSVILGDTSAPMAPKSAPSPIPMMAPTSAPQMVLPSYPGTQIPNPLMPQDQNVLQMLLSGGQGFGQAALNQFLNAGKSLTGLFSNLPPAIFGRPQVVGDIVG